MDRDDAVGHVIAEAQDFQGAAILNGHFRAGRPVISSERHPIVRDNFAAIDVQGAESILPIARASC